MDPTTDRRDFLRIGGVAAAGLAVAAVAGAADDDKKKEKKDGALKNRDLLRKLIPGAVDAENKYVLPALPYAHEALEPHIDAATMKLHHEKHHASYVKGLIAAEEKLAEMRASGDFAAVQAWTQKASFHGAGHFLHCVFWDSMGPGAGGEPKGALAKRIANDFGSFASFKSQFAAAAKQVEGSGWAILAMQLAAAPRLTVMQAEKHQLLSQWGLVPLLCIDVWEHAYYLKYQNDRGAYVDAWWNVVNWDRVGARFEIVAGADVPA